MKQPNVISLLEEFYNKMELLRKTCNHEKLVEENEVEFDGLVYKKYCKNCKTMMEYHFYRTDNQEVLK